MKEKLKKKNKPVAAVAAEGAEAPETAIEEVPVSEVIGQDEKAEEPADDTEQNEDAEEPSEDSEQEEPSEKPEAGND